LRVKKFGIVFLLLLAVGCQSAFQRDANYGGIPREVDSKNVTLLDSLRLVPESADVDVEARFSCDVQRSADKTLAGFVDAALDEAYRHARGEDRNDVAASGVRGVRDAFFDDYREWFAEDGDGLVKGEIAKHVACWTCHVEGRVEFCDKHYFSYRVTIDTYCGGPHGNRWIQNATYSRKDGRRLTAVDVVKKESMTDVVNLIRKAVRAEAQEDQLRAQLSEEIRLPYDAYVRDIRNGKRDEWGDPLVTDNFMLTKDGIVWTYNQYEIACYAAGWFDALVTWKALDPHLHDGIR